MQKSDKNQVAKVNRRKVQASTTLSRKYTKRPAPSSSVKVKITRSPKVKRFNDEPIITNVVASADMGVPVNATTQKDTTMEDSMATSVEAIVSAGAAEMQMQEAMQEEQDTQMQESQMTEASAQQEGQETQVEAMQEQEAQEQAMQTAMQEESVQGGSEQQDQQMWEALTQSGSAQDQQTQSQQMQSQQMQSQQMQEEPMQMAMPHPMQTLANTRMQERAAASQERQAPKVSAKELKDQAIQKALASASRMDSGKDQMKSEKSKTKKSNTPKLHFGFGRVMLALGCAAAAVFAIVYFVNINMPDISLRVAAMQTGIDPTYPNYVPRDYNVSSITSEEGKITMEFSNSTTGDSFTLIEEKSSWDTNALASNYVKEEYGENYSIIREQGLTIYISGSDAAWVNGGIVYKIDTTSGSLTNKQIRSIATSL